ncbi:MAG: PQQ-binding-like beta-propeller repeat protein [archaeon]
MKRRKFLAVSAGAGLGVAGCLGAADRALPEVPTGDWTDHAHDVRNTGSATVSVPPRGNRAWESGAPRDAAPLVADEAVLSVGETATALEAKTGDQLWERELPGTAEQTPSVDSSRLFVTTDQQLVALAREDGEQQWTVPLARPARRPVTASPEHSLVTVPLSAQQGTPGLVAYDAATGDVLWEDQTLAARTAAIADGLVYATGYRQDGETGVVRGLAVSDGSRQWETELTSPDAPPVVTDDGVFVADGGTLALHDPGDGTRRRSLGTFGDRIAEIPAVTAETAFVTASDGAPVAVSIGDGTTLWRNDVGVVAGTGVSVGQGAVVGSVTNLQDRDQAGIAAFERSDGTVRWEHPIEGFDAFPSTPPVLAEGAVFYVSNENRGVVALGDLPPAK